MIMSLKTQTKIDFICARNSSSMLVKNLLNFSIFFQILHVYWSRIPVLVMDIINTTYMYVGYHRSVTVAIISFFEVATREDF